MCFFSSSNYHFFFQILIYHYVYFRISRETDFNSEKIIADGLKADVSLYLLYNRSYNATRRRTYTTLPGLHSCYSESRDLEVFSEMEKSNNNENYKEIDDENKSENNIENKYENEKGNKNKDYRIMLPVGIDQHKKVRITASRIFKRNHDLLSKLDKKKFLGKSEDDMKTIFKSKEYETEIKSLMSPRSVLKSINIPSTISQYTFLKKMKKSVVTSLDEEDENVDTFVTKIGILLCPNPYTEKNHKKEMFPKGIYLGRRTSFSLLPGLESFLNYENCETDSSGCVGNDMRLSNIGCKRSEFIQEALNSNQMKRTVENNYSTYASLFNIGSTLQKPRTLSVTFSPDIVEKEWKEKDDTRSPTRSLHECDGNYMNNEPPYIKSDNLNQASTDSGFLRCFNINGSEMCHHGAINDAVFSLSEKRVASAGGDKLIKIWDPRDGSYVRSLAGHKGEVNSVRYTTDEIYLVSAGSDMEILIWDLISAEVICRLLGHSDIITNIAISSDCHFIVSSSLDTIIKTWYLTPRRPDAPEPPQLMSKTDTTAMIKWSAPSAFNLELSAYHLQHRVGSKGPWIPSEFNSNSSPAYSLPPWSRSKTLTKLEPCTPYQFRLCAENEMGRSDWSKPSKSFKTEIGPPTQLQYPTSCYSTANSITLFCFVPNPALYGAASDIFHITRTVNLNVKVHM